MNVTGKLVEIYPTNDVSNKFRKREFAVEYSDNPQFPQYIKFEFIQDSCEELDKYKVGQDVMIEFDLRGRKWVNPTGQTVYFNTLQAWRISPANTEASQTPPPPVPQPGTDGDDGDDLPF